MEVAQFARPGALATGLCPAADAVTAATSPRGADSDPMPPTLSPS
jgi:hypothetical protein